MLPGIPVPLPPGIGLPETVGQESFAELFRRAIEETSRRATLEIVRLPILPLKTPADIFKQGLSCLRDEKGGVNDGS